MTYHAPNTAKTFSSTLVDVSVDGSGAIVRDANGKPVDSPDQDDIFLAANGYSTGQAVLYTASDPSKAIGDLVSGTVYYVIKVTNDVLRLAATPADATAGTAIALVPDKSQTGKAVTHSLSPAGDRPIGPLVDGDTYYVVVINPNRIGLAATPGGPLLDLDATSLTGTDTLGTEGVDISPSSGKQSLVLDFTSASTGANRLLAPGGLPLSTSGVSGDGQSTANATGSGGGLLRRAGSQCHHARHANCPGLCRLVTVNKRP